VSCGKNKNPFLNLGRIADALKGLATGLPRSSSVSCPASRQPYINLAIIADSLGQIAAAGGFGGVQVQEVIGTGDDAETVFSLTSAPLPGQFVLILADNVPQISGFTRDGQTVTFDVAPAADVEITAIYMRAP
jgi:hypothetical protein